MSEILWRGSSAHNPVMWLERGAGGELLLKTAANRVSSGDPANRVFEEDLGALVSSGGLSSGCSVLALGWGCGGTYGMLRGAGVEPGRVVGVELDPAVIWVWRRFFAREGEVPDSLFCADALAWAESCEESFDLVLVDVFSNGSVPKVFTEPGFARSLSRLLRGGGTALWNFIGDRSEVVGSLRECVAAGLDVSLRKHCGGWNAFGNYVAAVRGGKATEGGDI